MSTFVTEINKLKNIQQNLEKNEVMLVEQISKLEEGLPIYELYKDSAKLRALQADKLQSDVTEIIVPLQKVNSMVTEENIANIDLKLVKREMTAIQNNIHNLKLNTKTSLNVLEEEEERFFEEVQAFEQKIHDWSKPSTASLQNRKNAKKVTTVISENVSQEVKDFVEFVAENGGHENGWTSDDHNLFLKYRIKTKDVNKLAETLHAILPDISEGEIISHEKWYLKYIELKEKQRVAIKNWRSSKTPQKKSPPKTNSPEQCALFKSFSECLNKEEMQQKVAAWKAEKFKQSKKEYEQEVQERIRQKQLERQQKQKHKQIKSQVENWRSTKKVTEEAEKLEKKMQQHREQKNRATKANKLIKQFQNQDVIYVQNKLQSRIRPKSAESRKISHIEAPRDPSRLLKPTKQWILRTYGNDNSGKSQSKLHLQAIPKLGIPEWRKSIN